MFLVNDRALMPCDKLADSYNKKPKVNRNPKEVILFCDDSEASKNCQEYCKNSSKYFQEFFFLFYHSPEQI